MLSACPLPCREPFPLGCTLLSCQRRSQHATRRGHRPPSSPGSTPTSRITRSPAALLRLRSVNREDERGSKQRKMTSPAPDLGRGSSEWPSLTLLVSRRSLSEGYIGRSPDSQIILLANAFPAVACQWLALLAFVPAHSGASVRELHPLPASVAYIAEHISFDQKPIMLQARCQAIFA
jgi:hypothetical protein